MNQDYMKPDLNMPYQILQACAVYGWIRGEDYLYIGQSQEVFARISRRHHIIDTREKVGPKDRIHIWFCRPEDISRVELALIRAFKPKYNDVRYREAVELSTQEVMMKRLKDLR